MTTTQIRVGRTGWATIDAADAELVAGFVWRLVSDGYAMAQRGRLMIYMHRLIAGAGPGEHVDHINGNTLDNRTCNLRIATRSENGANRGPDRRRLGTTSRHKGVSWAAARGHWRAYIHHEGKTRYLGTFTNEDDAARAYNAAAIATWGEFARLNEVGDAR